MGLDAGADDYVVKPFDFQELTLASRFTPPRQFQLTSVLGGRGLPKYLWVTYGSQALHLSQRVWCSELFLRNKQRVFSQVNHRSLWSFEDPPEEDTIKSHIKGLQKLKAAGAPTDLIETVMVWASQGLYLTGKVPNTHPSPR